MTSDATLESARAGDPAALEELLRDRRAQVVRYAMRLCISPEDAEDAAQEVLISLSRYIASLREVAALSSWLFLAVRTHCTRLARRSLRHALSLDGDTPLSIEGPSPEEQLVDRQLRHRLSHLIGDLDPKLRDVLLRRDVLGETAEDVAASLGLGIPAVKSRLHRARTEIKERLLEDLRREARKKSSPPSILRILLRR